MDFSYFQQYIGRNFQNVKYDLERQFPQYTITPIHFNNNFQIDENIEQIILKYNNDNIVTDIDTVII
jgi:hypothetical protein